MAMNRCEPIVANQTQLGCTVRHVQSSEQASRHCHPMQQPRCGPWVWQKTKGWRQILPGQVMVSPDTCIRPNKQIATRMPVSHCSLT
eukprot:5337197-Amphidinium_carterae.3